LTMARLEPGSEAAAVSAPFQAEGETEAAS
jgi:hypothetical protein